MSQPFAYAGNRSTSYPGSFLLLNALVKGTRLEIGDLPVGSNYLGSLVRLCLVPTPYSKWQPFVAKVVKVKVTLYVTDMKCNI